MVPNRSKMYWLRDCSSNEVFDGIEWIDVVDGEFASSKRKSEAPSSDCLKSICIPANLEFLSAFITSYYSLLHVGNNLVCEIHKLRKRKNKTTPGLQCHKTWTIKNEHTVFHKNITINNHFNHTCWIVSSFVKEFKMLFVSWKNKKKVNSSNHTINVLKVTTY